MCDATAYILKFRFKIHMKATINDGIYRIIIQIIGDESEYGKIFTKNNAVTPREHPLFGQSNESSRLFCDHLQDKRQGLRPLAVRAGFPSKTHKHQMAILYDIYIETNQSQR